MRLDKQEEKEMESLLDEIPRATFPHHHRSDHDAIHASGDGNHHGLPLLDISGGVYDDSYLFHGLNHHPYGYAHAYVSPAGSPASLSGTAFPDDLGLLDGLRSLRIGAPATGQPPEFANNSVDPSLFLAGRGNAADEIAANDYGGASRRLANLFDDPMSFYYNISNRNSYEGDFDSFSYESLLKNNRKWADLSLDAGALNFPKSPQTVLPQLHPRSPVANGRLGLFPDILLSANPQSPVNNIRSTEAVDCEGSLIIQPKWLRYVGSNKHNRGNAGSSVDSVRSPGLCHSPIESLKYDHLMDVEGYIYYLALDQYGCRFLQWKFNEGKHQVDKIFNGIIDHVAELMVNPFGNYLVQKLLHVCSEDQRTRIVVMLTEDTDKLIRISLNVHGTRAVQKLIDTLKTRQQIALVVSALQPGFLDLIKDLNGSHVLQHCLNSLTAEDNKFIFEAATKHCVAIATHQHGCCVLQRCIEHSTGQHRAKLVSEISANGLLLAQDAYGNYVVQFIIELNHRLAIATLASLFEGNYVHLSTQKFSSNVVEKCLKVFGEQNRAMIIIELLSVPRFEQLLQDPYANYVIQSALVNSKGSLHTALVEAIRPHAAMLRTSPYCKRIFSRSLRKK